MPEWTGARRAEFYHCLAEGRITDAQAIIEAQMDLKVNDLKPVKREALAAMSQAIARRPEPQQVLIAMLCSPLRHVRVCARMLFDHIEEFSGDLLAEAFPVLTQEIVTECMVSVLESYRKVPKGLSGAERRKWAADYYSRPKRKPSDDDDDDDDDHRNIFDISEWMGPYTSMTTAMQERLLSLVEVICLFPTAKNWDLLDDQFKSLLGRRFGNRVSEPLRAAEDRLNAENLSGYVKRTGLRQLQEKNKKTRTAVAAPRKRERKAPVPEMPPLTPQDKERILAELLEYDILYSLKHEEYLNPPAAIQKEVNRYLTPLAQELDMEIMWRLRAAKWSIVASLLMRAYAMILLQRFSFEATVMAARQKAEELMRQRPRNQDDPQDRLYACDCESLWRSIFQARAAMEPLFAISHNYSLPGETVQDFIADPLDAAELANRLESGEPFEMDSAFREAFENPARLAPCGRTLLDLASAGLWQVKIPEAIKSVHRLHALAEFGKCQPAETATTIEQAFSIEAPALWRAAAEAIRALRKKEPTIKLQYPDRIQELLDRDPEKYGKFLRPLLA